MVAAATETKQPVIKNTAIDSNIFVLFSCTWSQSFDGVVICAFVLVNDFFIFSLRKGGSSGCR